jgi:hypothetical protein
VRKTTIEFNPEVVRASMDQWRRPIDLKLPLEDEFKIATMRDRKPIVGNVVQAAATRLSLLNAMKPAHVDAGTGLQSLRV